MILKCFDTLHFAVLYDSNGVKSLFLARASNQDGRNSKGLKQPHNIP